MSLAVSILAAVFRVALHVGHVQCFLPVGHRGPGGGGHVGGEDGKAGLFTKLSV